LRLEALVFLRAGLVKDGATLRERPPLTTIGEVVGLGVWLGVSEAWKRGKERQSVIVGQSA
jgi:hypothetical protein